MIEHELITTTINKALEEHKPFQYVCEDREDKMILQMVRVEVKSLQRIYHEYYWGDFRDEGLDPLLCVEIEFVINKATKVQNEEVVDVIVKAFNETQGVELFECSIEHKVLTRFVKKSNEVKTSSHGLVFKVMASEDPRLQ